MAKVRRAGGSASAVRKVARKVARTPVAKKRLKRSKPGKAGVKPKVRAKAGKAGAVVLRGSPSARSRASSTRDGSHLRMTAKETAEKTTKPAATRTVIVKRFGRRAPSPMNFTDNLLADARRRYETTLEPITWIAHDLEVTRTTLRSFAAKNGWVRFNAPPLDLSPAAQLAQKTDAFIKATDVAAPPAPDDAATGEAPAEGPEMAEFLRREVKEHLRRVTEMHQQRAGLMTVEDGLKLGRLLVLLTDMHFKLERYTSGAALHADLPDDMPEDIDEFRIDLARRIDAFVASRAHDGDAEEAGAAAPVDAV